MPQRSPAHVALGRVIRDLRTQLAISQEELANRCDMDRTYVGGIERGEKNPSYEKMLRIAAALDVRISELVTEADRYS